jgi:hypothetical protein
MRRRPLPAATEAGSSCPSSANNPSPPSASARFDAGPAAAVTAKPDR